MRRRSRHSLTPPRPRRFSVLSGAAPGFYAALCVGAVGGVIAAACVVPELCVRLRQLTGAGRHAEARELQRSLTPLAALITTTHGVPGLKAALDLAGYKGASPRPPLMPLGAPRPERRSALRSRDCKNSLSIPDRSTVGRHASNRTLISHAGVTCGGVPLPMRTPTRQPQN